MSEVNQELKNILEAALLVAGKPLTLKRMTALFPKDSEPTADELKQAIAALEQDYADRGVELKQVGKGWRFQSREKYSEWVSRLSEERPARYSRALLETLAIIAYRQPVTRGDIEEIRGVTVSSDTMRTLQEREWVREVGHRDVPGKPALFGTTPGFLEHFNLKSLSELPPLSELRDLEEISRELNFSLDFGSAEDNEAEGEATAAAEASDAEASEAEAGGSEASGSEASGSEASGSEASGSGAEPAAEVEAAVERGASGGGHG
jgi:segregation and condensation protein B